MVEKVRTSPFVRYLTVLCTAKGAVDLGSFRDKQFQDFCTTLSGRIVQRGSLPMVPYLPYPMIELSVGLFFQILNVVYQAHNSTHRRIEVFSVIGTVINFEYRVL